MHHAIFFVGFSPQEVYIGKQYDGLRPCMRREGRPRDNGGAQERKPQVSGSWVQNAQSYMQNAIYMAILPGLLIVLTIFAFNKLGNLLRIFVEPRVMSGEKD